MNIIYHIAKYQTMLKYMQDILIAANGSYSWYKNGGQLCLRRVSIQTMSWREICSKFWLLYVTNQ